MADKEAYNYKKVFSHPVTLYRLGDWTLPFGISLARLAVAAFILLLMIIFRDFFNALAFIPGLQLVMYIGVPFFVSGFLMKQRFNGKKIHHFMIDLFNYAFTIYFPKRKYANDEQVLYSNEKQVTFEPYYVERKGDNVKQEKGGRTDEVKDTYQNDTQQLDANKVG